MKNIYNCIPESLIEEAKKFVCNLNDDVDIYKKLKGSGLLENCIEADKFVAYWTLGSYSRYPHALITLYENMSEIDNSIDKENNDNSFSRLQYKMKSYYLLLKENDLIGE